MGLSKTKPRKSDGSVYVCKCECGGNVRGVRDFGQLWTWCEKCTPVQTVKVLVRPAKRSKR